MSSLLQFKGEVTRRGVGLEMYHVKPGKRWPDSAILGEPTEIVDCPKCNGGHPRLNVVWRKPRGMFGCWVVFQYNGEEHIPDLSIPIPLFCLPKDAKPLSEEETVERWHS